jgi:hypothetical protein
LQNNYLLKEAVMILVTLVFAFYAEQWKIGGIWLYCWRIRKKYLKHIVWKQLQNISIKKACLRL